MLGHLGSGERQRAVSSNVMDHSALGQALAVVRHRQQSVIMSSYFVFGGKYYIVLVVCVYVCVCICVHEYMCL